MKKNILILFCLLFGWVLVSKAQSLIAVQNNNPPLFFTNLDSAIVHAQSGDTLFLPGGNFPIYTNIDKCLHIIGVGHNPDSTLATNPTNIIPSSALYLITGASNGSFESVKITGSVFFGTNSSNGNISNYEIIKCYISGILHNYSTLSSNNLFRENIFVCPNHCIQMNNAASNYFYNNIIQVSQV